MSRRRAWYSRKVGRHGRIIVSRTGVRPAYRGRHIQISPRSTFIRIGGVKVFSTHHRR